MTAPDPSRPSSPELPTRSELDAATAERDEAQKTLANAQGVVVDILGIPASNRGAVTITIPNHQAAAWRKRAGLAYGTQEEAKAADEAWQREAEYEATRSETDL